MKKILFAISVLSFLTACTVNKTSDKQLVGNDKDKNNCIGSAGYQWSELEKKCLRPFEEGIKLNAVNNSTYAAYLIKKHNKIELFSIETSPSLIMEKQTENSWQNGDWKVEFLNGTYTVTNKNILLYQK